MSRRRAGVICVAGKCARRHCGRRRAATWIQVVPTALGVTTGLLGGFAIAQTSDSPDAVYIESATHGQVSNRPEDVKVVQGSYDTVRAEAQPQPGSIELIREAEKRWT
ncbi:Scr1 family TA system antitoxin-like transcriptional regulator [Sphaerisporangium sp. NPDC051011]|uniref:Scr1 family TA system antitoxin-like transcriptional regulator n=1 Tax=Sphaerisporangium sp. NPDC051011 TaxID=3155792 RepID=UPI0033E24542